MFSKTECVIVGVILAMLLTPFALKFGNDYLEIAKCGKAGLDFQRCVSMIGSR